MQLFKWGCLEHLAQSILERRKESGGVKDKCETMGPWSQGFSLVLRKNRIKYLHYGVNNTISWNSQLTTKLKNMPVRMPYWGVKRGMGWTLGLLVEKGEYLWDWCWNIVCPKLNCVLQIAKPYVKTYIKLSYLHKNIYIFLFQYTECKFA